MSDMPRIVVESAKRRFGVKPRKQWRVSAYAANGTNLSLSDSYANLGDVRKMLKLLRGPVELLIHYDNGTQRELLQ